MEGDQPPLVHVFDDLINDLHNKLKSERPFVKRFITDKSGKVVDYELNPVARKVLAKYPPMVAVTAIWAMGNRPYNRYPYNQYRMTPLLAELIGKRREFAESISYVGEETPPSLSERQNFHYRRLCYMFTVEGFRWLVDNSPDVDAVLPPLELPEKLRHPPKAD